MGLPCALQQILIGPRVVADGDALLPGGSSEELAEVETTLLVQLPVPNTRLEAKWVGLEDTSHYLEELRVRDRDLKDAWQWPPHLVPCQGMGAAGLDPDSGLLVLVGAGLREHFQNRVRHHRGYDSGDGSDSFYASDLEREEKEEAEAAEGQQTPSLEYVPFPWQPSFRLSKRRRIEAFDRRSPGRPRSLDRRDTRFRNPTKNNLLVVLPDGPPLSLPLDSHDPLVTAVEIHALAAEQGYPFPSFGVAVALSTGSRKKFAGPLMLVSCELSPVARSRSLTAAGTDCQAACLDRAGQVAISADVRLGGRYISFHPLRPQGSRTSMLSLPTTEATLSKASRALAWLTVLRNNGPLKLGLPNEDIQFSEPPQALNPAAPIAVFSVA